jgi:hypothetical protein
MGLVIPSLPCILLDAEGRIYKVGILDNVYMDIIDKRIAFVSI